MPRPELFVSDCENSIFNIFLFFNCSLIILWYVAWSCQSRTINSEVKSHVQAAHVTESAAFGNCNCKDCRLPAKENSCPSFLPSISSFKTPPVQGPVESGVAPGLKFGQNSKDGQPVKQIICCGDDNFGISPKKKFAGRGREGGERGIHVFLTKSKQRRKWEHLNFLHGHLRQC